MSEAQTHTQMWVIYTHTWETDTRETQDPGGRKHGHQRDTGPWWPETTEQNMVSCLGQTPPLRALS